MKKINNYWVDENNNKWWCGNTTEEQAIAYSESLIACSNCYNCHDCNNCHYCDGCYYCDDCCDCHDCDNCNNCRDCYRCAFYTKNPMLYRTDRIGSRGDHTLFYYDGMLLQVVCGCFRGDLKEFETMVLKTHANNEVYRNQYLKEIAKVKTLFELEV